MSEFEQIGLLLQVSEGVNAQFEFWVGVTFAAIIATYTAGDRLNPIARGILAIMYLATCAIFYQRISNQIGNAQVIVGALNEMGSDWLTQASVSIQPLRRGLIIAGSLLVASTIMFPKMARLARSKSDDI